MYPFLIYLSHIINIINMLVEMVMCRGVLPKQDIFLRKVMQELKL